MHITDAMIVQWARETAHSFEYIEQIVRQEFFQGMDSEQIVKHLKEIL
jgi:hypothetical protein